MRTKPISGPSPDRISKRRIAEMQLYRAIKLLEGEGPDYGPLSALTLAGAAEEILGKMAAAKGMPTAFEDATDAAKQLRKFVRSLMGKKPGKPPKDGTIRRRLNRVRNAVKHNDPGRNSYVTAYFYLEAEDMIRRGIRNYKKLYRKPPPQNEVQEWWDQMCD